MPRMHVVRTRPAFYGFKQVTPLKLLGALLMVLALTPLTNTSAETPKQGTIAFHGKLDNGLEVVVVPDRRAPVVTHMVWYRAGGADEPQGKSGIAHFLEHLMFKGTDTIPAGEFSKIVARLGGQDNAFTAQDITAYFQRVAKEKLPDVMRMEADRMANLRLEDKDVTTERKVIIEERRSRVDNDPGSLLQEQMMAALYTAHPYHTPVIGWEPEMRGLMRADALTFYKKFYAPNNAILVVTGDVEPEQVMALAKDTYGKVNANPEVGGPRRRPESASRSGRPCRPARPACRPAACFRSLPRAAGSVQDSPGRRPTRDRANAGWRSLERRRVFRVVCRRTSP